MWAAIKSPLLMGNDLRTLSASSLTILNNPAVIAINQDPVGRPAARVRRDFDIAKDKYGIGEFHIWSGPLYDGDQVVVLLNAGGEEKEVTVSLSEIFVHEGPEGSAPQVKGTWDVYDVWGNRMKEDVAHKILDASAEEAGKILLEEKWYNSTTLSYEKGLAKEDSRLLGRLVGRIESEGSLTKSVRAHSVEMFRLRRIDRRKSGTSTREEL